MNTPEQSQLGKASSYIDQYDASLLFPIPRASKRAEIAQMACFLLSDRASYVNGQAIPVDGGLSASHPWVFPR